MRNTISLFLLLLFTMNPVEARQPDAALGLIITPSNCIPTLTQPGGSFVAVLKKDVPLILKQGEESFPLQVSWTALPEGGGKADCTLPTDLSPGVYSLLAQQEDSTEENTRAVYVYDAFPDHYTFAHLTDVHIGKDRSTPNSSDETFRKILTAVNASEAAFVVITGDITENGESEQFQRFLKVLDTCTLPTLLSAGNHDRDALNYEAYIGPLAYVFRFGEDGYLTFDTKDFRIADDLNPQNTLLEQYRRQIMSCRWAIGLTHRYDFTMGMRSQITLFVDNPMDYVIYGHYHRENEEALLPWGTTKRIATPAAINGSYRFIEVSPKKLVPAPPEYVWK
jgi:predicted phosphodiesterase